MDFSRKKVLEDLANKEVNCGYRLNLLEDVVLYTEGLIDELIERGKNFFFNRNIKKLYNRLYEEKEKGKVFKREDLTYDILLKLSVIENMPDSVIGYLFDMTKSQVRYARKKSGLVNISIVKLKLFPESYAYYLEENGQRGEGISNYILEDIIQEIGNFSSAFIPHNEDEIAIEEDGVESTYYINFSSSEYAGSTKNSGKRSKGSKRNQKREDETRKKHGKIGGKIVLEAEKIRLERLGLGHLIDKVTLVSQVDEEITLDGLGYDLISFNENGEKICIEVKTFYGKKDRPFFISSKEVEMMQGLSEEYECRESFIYYVLIDGSNVTIKTIDSVEFSKMKLTPYLYKVERLKSEK